MMSKQNVDITLAAFDAWNRGDSRTFDALHHAEIVLVPPEGWPETRFEGLEEAHRQFAQLKDAWSDDRIEIDRVEDAGDKVVVDWRLITIGKASGIVTEKAFTSISTVREGLITRVEYFFDRAKALEAAGLSE